MGTELLEIGVKMRKCVIFTIRGCFRSVCNHPFLVGVLCFLIFLYRSSPLIFSLLVTASPVLICTAVLLGILLSFGQPNIPEIEREEKTTHEVVSMKMGMSGDATVVEKNESCYVERYSEKKRDEAEQLTELPSLSARGLGDVCREDSVDDTAPLIQEKLQETELENGEDCAANRELGVMRSKQKTDWNEERLSDGEAMDNHYASIPKMNDDERLESDYDKSEAESFDSERVNVDSLDSPPRSPWKQVDDREDEEEEDDGALDSGSDRAESSSPDASMADIMPMLDELHPLLDEEAPQPVHIDGSDAASEQSPKSSSSSHESDDETENHEDLEVVDEDNEDGEDEEDAQGDKEEQTKSAITWTDEDQKNLMDLGSSEIERNQRLENLILRRRSRKNMSMVLERNLIDLESSDLGFNVAPISTTRHNPFDLPHDSYDNSGLPPIPGSAPSILLPRRNPFDIPYDSSEEKPNLLGDGFQEEFTTFQPREPFFRRHESFNVGPSIFAPNRQERQERQDVKLRPYFVPERMVSEESSYSPFQRQSSELSDSKVSSVPETESLGSVEDLEDRRLSEEDNPPELESIYGMKEVIEEVPSGDPEMISMREDIPEEFAAREPELISEMEHVSEHVGHGSQSSEEDESLELGQVEKRDVEVDELEFQLGDAEDHCEESSVIQPLEDTGYHSNSEAVEQRYSRGSSSSSLSEVSERVFNETGGEQMPILEQRSDGIGEESGISTQTSVGSTNLSITLADGAPHREPVYDSSPPSVRKNFSSSSNSSDLHAESDLGLPPVLVKRTVSFIERESEGSSQEIEKDIPSNIEMLPESSTHHHVNENESAQIDVFNIGEHDSISSHFSGVVQRTASSAKVSVEKNIMDQQTQVQVPSSSSHGLVKSSEDQNLGQLEEKHLLISEKESLQVNTPSVKGHLTPEHSIDKEEIVQSPNSDADVYHEAYEKLMSTPSAEGNSSLFYDKAVQEPTPKNLNEVQAPSTLGKSFEEGRSIQNLGIQEVRDLDHDISSYVNSPLSPDFISIPSSASEIASPPTDMQTIIEEEDEIKDIDEGLLSELDSVGDFSIKQWGSGSNEFKKHTDSIGESLSSADHAETSTTDVEVNPVEVNKIEHVMDSENSREVIDIHEEDMECISELQTLEMGIAEHIDISNKEFNERDGQDSPDQDTSEEEMTFSKENGVEPADSVAIHDYEDDRDVMFLTKKAESTSVETEVMVEGAEASPQTQVDMDATHGMLELEARTLEDIDLVFKKISDKEIEKPVILETPQAELVIGETKAEHLEYGTLHINSDFTDSTHETPIPEVRSIKDSPLDRNQVNDGGTESHTLPDSVDHILQEVDSRETLGTSSELHVAEAISAEGTSLPPKQVLDDDREKQLKPNSNDGLIEFKADKEDSCLDTELSMKAISTAATEKSDHEVEALDNLHSTKSGKGKGKISKSSSSSSSSSSESSSSDSD